MPLDIDFRNVIIICWIPHVVEPFGKWRAKQPVHGFLSSRTSPVSALNSPSCWSNSLGKTGPAKQSQETTLCPVAARSDHLFTRSAEVSVAATALGKYKLGSGAGGSARRHP